MKNTDPAVSTDEKDAMRSMFGLDPKRELRATTGIGPRIAQRADDLGRTLTAEEMIPFLAAEAYQHKDWHRMTDTERALVNHLERAGYIVGSRDGFTGSATLPTTETP